MALPHKREKIVRSVRQWLAAGRYKPGDRFPSDQELARKFDVTHVTVRSAIKPLVDEGLLQRRIGWGTLVCDPTTQHSTSEALLGAVGVAIPDTTHSFFSEVLRAIEAELHPSKRPLVLGHTWDLPSREETILRAWADQGIRHIIVAPSGKCAKVYHDLIAQGVRLVFVDRDEPGLDVPAIISRDEAAVKDLAAKLFAATQHQVFHLAGPTNVFTAKARQRGFQAALTAAGVTKPADYVVPSGFLIEDGYRATQALLKRKGPAPQALLAANDPVAVGALRALAQQGLEVPGDVVVVGYGDTDLARNFDLTSVRQFPDRMGTLAVRMLASIAPTSRNDGAVLEPKIVERGSTGTLRIIPVRKRV